MTAFYKVIFIILVMSGIGFGQYTNKTILRADFNKLITQYGKDRVRLSLPAKQVMDSLRRAPYIWAEGYRIQLFASHDEQKALSLKRDLEEQVKDSVYVIKDNALYRVQFGDYTDRIVAETKVDSMRKYGWPSAWIVTRRVKNFIRKKDEQIAIPGENNMEILSEYYAVQVAAYSTMEAAQLIQQQLQLKFKDVDILEISGLYKVVIGRMTHHKDADSLAEQIKANGYADAWVTLVTE